MVEQRVEESGLAMLAEAALRNLHLDCIIEQGGEDSCSSRMLHFDGNAMLIAELSHHGRRITVEPGRRMICSCRLGREIVRFGAVVAGRRWFLLNSSKRVAALVLEDLGDPTVVQRRRYFRVSLARHDSADITLWIVKACEDRSIVCGEVTGQIADVSGGGAGLVVDTDEMFRDLDDKQIWARLALPGENESLIFRVSLRQVRPVGSTGTFHVGVEFEEYVDPGRHQRVIDDIVRFVSQQERIELRRLADR